ncbi:VWA domain-containing protein [Gammaproteobacteria bacterium]|jgi:hypothetical protein|nr:VWA domain-containing protein [Gammaproteobacteria bacterium]
MKKRRDTEIFSLSFLDIITCGFGAIILLLVITNTGISSTSIEMSPDTSDNGLIRNVQEQLFEVRGKTNILSRDLTDAKEQLSGFEQRVAHLNRKKYSAENRLSDLQEHSSVQSSITNQFESAKQSLTKEMQRLLSTIKNADTELVGGIPVDSEYIIFIVDTSGSMVQVNWGKMIQQLTTTLDVYPNVKGLQIMSDMGNYLYSQYRGKWIPDTPGRRRAMISNLSSWNTFSNSSPVEGITRAISAFYDPNKKISIYVFGDEFTGKSITNVVKTIDRLNPKDNSGNTKIRIHGVGFPIPENAPEHFQITSQRYATLMREVSQKNGGTFIGVN